MNNNTSIAEEEEREGVGEEKGKGGEVGSSNDSGMGYDSVDGGMDDDSSSSEVGRRQSYRDRSNWTQSLDRRSTLSPKRDRGTPDEERACLEEVDNPSSQNAVEKTRLHRDPAPQEAGHMTNEIAQLETGTVHVWQSQ